MKNYMLSECEKEIKRIIPRLENDIASEPENSAVLILNNVLTAEEKTLLEELPYVSKVDCREFAREVVITIKR